MNHDYILTVRFSTETPIDKASCLLSDHLIRGVADTVRNVFDIDELTIKSFRLEIGRG